MTDDGTTLLTLVVYSDATYVIDAGDTDGAAVGRLLHWIADDIAARPPDVEL